VQGAATEAEVLQAAQQAASIASPTERIATLGDAAVKLSEPAITNATEHALSRFGEFLEPNPRSMKTFVNTYGVLRSLRTLEEVFVASGPLARWTVIEIRWPYLADYLRTHPDAVELDPNDTLPEEVRLLLCSDPVKQLFNDDRSGPMTADLIRQCAGSE
jgi:hypothetical protein